MKSKKKIYLLGMPSSGKSTIGKLLSSFLGLQFVDLDDVIEEKEGMEITDIFAVKGEPYFREIEHKNLRSQTEQFDGFVMATGGGTPCYFDSMDYMNRNGITVFLKVNIEDLYAKLSKKGSTKRPLLKGKTSEELYLELKTRYDARVGFYSKAQIVIDQSFKDIAERTNEVLFAIKTLEKNSH
ncbi:MAG: shikimate kinase [Cyclobacteriaceae bacterium]|nr:shikimate kinase [Cyclobacteriaceae bacterium]